MFSMFRWIQVFKTFNSLQNLICYGRIVRETCIRNSSFQFSTFDHEREKCDKGKDLRENGIAADLAVMTNDTPDPAFSSLKTISVVPGKGRPPEPPITCCMSGCANCVWISYAEELKEYYGDGGEQALKALDQIEDPSLKAFIKLELGL